MLNSLILALIFSIRGQNASETYPTEQASPYITLENSRFGPNIEGTAVNAAGQLFSTSYGAKDPLYRIGRITYPQAEFYVDNKANSYVNSVRFLSKHEAYVGDVVNHRVLKLEINNGGKVTKSSELCSNKEMIQPNDIALGSNGVVFTSGSRFAPTTSDKSGDIWVCEPGKPAKKLLVMGRTNGIEVSNDNSNLYVSEAYDKDGKSIVQKIWKFHINSDYTLSDKELFADFETLDGTQADHIDGMRFDIKGNLYVIRHGGQHVTVLDPSGKINRKIKLNFTYPTNLELGGKDGKELYIVGRCGILTPEGHGKGCVDRISVPYPGRAFTNLQASHESTDENSDL
jgi:sugar lactone lactonase YvrE